MNLLSCISRRVFACRQLTFKTSLFLRTLVAAGLFLASLASGRAQSALDGFDPNANGLVRVVVVQPDGKILLGGDFTTLAPNGGAAVTRNRIARLNPDGTLDTQFDPGADGTVFALALQTDGSVLAGGGFTSIGGQVRPRLARLDPATGLADSFTPNPDNDVFSLMVQPDGKILAGGDFTSIGGAPRGRLARVDPATGLADSFDPNANGRVITIALQANGKILAGGTFTNIGGASRNRIARLDPTTGSADAFDPNANNTVFAIAVQADGKIVVGGVFAGTNSIGGAARGGLARLDATTGLADSFDPNASDFPAVYAVALQSDGKILAGGFFSSIAGQSRLGLARFDSATGSLDSFDPSPNNSVVAIALQPDGKILTAGYFTALAPNAEPATMRNRIARLERDGRLDRTLDLNMSGTGSYVYETALQPDGKILIGGSFSTVLGVPRRNIARLNSDGTLDMAFDPNANFAVYSMVIQNDGKILVGGSFTNIGGQTRSRIARLDPSTGAADAFDPNPNSSSTSIALQPDGKILVTGEFTMIGGQPRNRMARLHPATGAADEFNPDPDNAVYTMAIQRDGKILVGGIFHNIGGQPRSAIARLDPATGAADAFDPNPNNGVQGIALQSDGKILVGGWFSSIGGAQRRCLARLDPTTGLADQFDTNPSGGVIVPIVSYLVAQSDGQVIVAGQFNNIGGQPRRSIARLDAATGAADAFNPNPLVSVASFAVQSDGKVLVAGDFSQIGGQPRQSFARLTNDTPALSTMTVERTAITLTRAGASVQFEHLIFEQSTDGGASYVFLGEGTPAAPLPREEKTQSEPRPLQPHVSSYSLAGLDLPTGQNFLIRARGRYRVRSSESIEDTVQNAFLLAPLEIASASSRKTHGSAGDFDIPLPLSGEPGIECRSSGGAHTMVVAFSNNVVSGNVSVTAGVGSVSGSPTFSANTMTVNLTGVTDVQQISVNLSGVTDSNAQILPDTSVTMNVLAGDTNGNKMVNATDVGQTRAQSSVPVTSVNFRQDVVVSGSINATDLALVKSRSGQSLP